jgi:hypothetical protein
MGMVIGHAVLESLWRDLASDLTCAGECDEDEVWCEVISEEKLERRWFASSCWWYLRRDWRGLEKGLNSVLREGIVEEKPET